jgi:ubiquinone/menaquinone biosynthesis C-methylase UbiE
MKNKTNKFWDCEALDALKKKPSDNYSYYIDKSYKTAVKKGLKHVLSRNIRLLKTDLWNESIETDRDVLGQYKDNKRFDLYGVDISQKVCKMAKANIKNLKIYQGKIQNLPFKNNYFEIVLDLSTLDHVSMKNAAKALKEYARVLKKEGIIVLIFWQNSFFIRKILKKKEEGGQYLFPLEEIRQNVKDAFNILEEYCTGTLISNPYTKLLQKKIPFQICSKLSNFILKLEYSKVSKNLLRDISGLYVIIGRKK